MTCPWLASTARGVAEKISDRQSMVGAERSPISHHDAGLARSTSAMPPPVMRAGFGLLGGLAPAIQPITLVGRTAALPPI